MTPGGVHPPHPLFPSLYSNSRQTHSAAALLSARPIFSARRPPVRVSLTTAGTLNILLDAFAFECGRSLARSLPRLQGAIAVAVALAVLAVILGIKTSLQAASNSKPFSMEGFEKKGKGGGGTGGDGAPMEPHERDTKEQDAPNGDWLTDPMCVPPPPPSLGFGLLGYLLGVSPHGGRFLGVCANTRAPRALMCRCCGITELGYARWIYLAKYSYLDRYEIQDHIIIRRINLHILL